MSKENPAVQSGKTDGGPAFGTTMGMGATDKPGMSLRDYFAAKSLPGIIIRAGERVGMGELPKSAQWANLAYEVADAMLERRSK